MSKFYFFIIALVVFSGCKKEKLDTGNSPVTPNSPTAAVVSVAHLNCAEARISSVAAVGASYSGMVTIPYTGGNGVSYSFGYPIESSGVKGLKATLQPGSASDSGSLIYSIAGTPLSTGNADFAVEFGSQHCSFSLAVSHGINTAPRVTAVDDIFLLSPGDSCILSGGAYDMENDALRITWTKLTGPAGEVIQNPNSLRTRVSGLKLGDYVFELTATDPFGLKASDTLHVSVFQPGQDEYVFQNLRWMCPMGCSVTIENFYSYIPAGKPFLVFLREGSTAPWQLVKPNSQWADTDIYSYGVGNNLLWVYRDDEVSGTVDIKIKY